MARQDYRDVDGVLILDKPGGMSSNQALQRVRRLFRGRKAGHCGSLDPLATGVLPVCFGQATRFSGYLLDASKAYRATLRFGQTTATADAEGEILLERPVNFERADLLSVLQGFIGEIEQVPPMYSALKHQGRRLYQLAREGQVVERAPRQLHIESLELVAMEMPTAVIDVRCSKGTYVRTLAEDIGEALGCGAHLAGLRRTAVAGFAIDQALTLGQLDELDESGRDACLLSAGVLLSGFPSLEIDAAARRDLGHGKRIQLPGEPSPGLYRLRDADGEFIGLGEVIDNGWLKVKRLMNTAR